jgi:hypothetical protein
LPAASRCEGRLTSEVFDGFIAVAARVLSEAAKIIHTDDPGRTVCPVCLAAQAAKMAAHALAKAEGDEFNTDVKTPDNPGALNADDIPAAAAPGKSPWR